MKKIIIVIMIVAFAIIYFGPDIADQCSSKKLYKSYEGTAAVVIIGGVKSDPGYLKALQSAFTGSIVIIPQRYYPFSSEAESILERIKKKGINGPIIIVAHSWGGLLARQLDINNPGLVRAIVTIGTPHFRDYPWMPDFVAEKYMRPHDGNSETPLHIVGGFIKSEDVKPIEFPSTKWGLVSTNLSDGSVDLSKVLNLGKRKVAAVAIFNAEHSELVGKAEVISQVKTWLEPKNK
jgi:pimeloyl-ACP methyl ester carboxylesterase